jgi:hypothetical protein
MQQQCLTSETIADYLEGRLSDRQRDRVEDHLARCDACLDVMLTAREVFHRRSADCMQVVPQAVTRRAIGGMERCAGGTWRDALMGRFKALSLEFTRLLHSMGYTGRDALAPVRGNKVNLSEDLVLLAHSFTGLDTEIEIEKIDTRSANVTVNIFGTDTRIDPVRVSLVRDQREVASYLVRRRAAFFDAVPFGRYALVYTRNGANLGKYDFSIKETPYGGKDA